MEQDNKEVVTEENKEDTKEPVQLSADEERAISLGWKPKDKWEGPETDWVPAKWWLRYGDVEQKVQHLEAKDKQKERVITAMKNHYVRVKEDAKREVLESIKRQKHEAIKNEDYAKVAELDLQADYINGNLETKFKEVDAQVQATVQEDNVPSQEFLDWNRKNSWYKLGSKDELTIEADRLARGFVSSNPGVSHGEVLDYVTTRIEKIFPDKFKKEPDPISPVDEGGGHRAPTKSGTKYKLSEAEKAAAARFGMTEAEYAKEIEAYNKRKGF